jgi:hypothetical protein
MGNILWLIAILAWLTHGFSCAKVGATLWGIMGLGFFPLGVLNGICIWLGFPLHV